jgi:nitroreductase
VTTEDKRQLDGVLALMRERRSAARVRPDEPPREAIETLLQAATWAPNHYRTAPWRFTVLTGDARGTFGDVLAASMERRMNQATTPPSPEERAAALAKERNKPLRAPVIIAVACLPSTAEKVDEIEEISAVAAGVQNMLLAAEALGLGAMWRTGAPARDPEAKRALGFPETSRIIAFVYVGYPDLTSQHERERDPAPYTTWLDH